MKKLFLLLIVLALATQSVVRAELRVEGRGGTGVGDGGGDERAKIVAQMTRELQGSYQGLNDLQDWCGRVNALLQRELRRANLQLLFSQHVRAFGILKDALVAAKQSLDQGMSDEAIPPYTKVLVDRALMIAQSLDETMKSGREVDQVVGEKLMATLVSNIILVSRELDPPYYLPYHYRSDFDPRSFEMMFLKLAAVQLKWVNQELTDHLKIQGEDRVFPLGDSQGRIYLTVSEIVAAGVAADVSQNLFAYQKACAISDLAALAADLSAFNLCGDRTVFPNERWAVEDTYEHLENAVRAFASNLRNCK